MGCRFMDRSETVRVDADALADLREAVLAEHGKLHGYLGREATNAIRKRAEELSH